jgi:hypothetical protein
MEAVMAKSVTYRKLPEEIDPVDFLFQREKLVVDESSLDPESILRIYDRTVETIETGLLHAKSAENPCGLESLPGMLSISPESHPDQWLSLFAPREMIERSLPLKTSYQGLFLPLFPFHIPKYEELPPVSWGKQEVVGGFQQEALLVGKNNKQLYYVEAEWAPAKQYFHQKFGWRKDDGRGVFELSHLIVDQVSWDDQRIVERVTDGRWSDLGIFMGRIQLALNGTATIMEARAKQLRGAATRLDDMPIYFGR